MNLLCYVDGKETTPPTYTAGEVVRILAGELEQTCPAKWDEAGIFRPSFYEAPSRSEGLMTRQERDAQRVKLGKTRGDPHRRYTFHDLVWLRFLLQVKKELALQGKRNTTKRAARLVDMVRALAGTDEPPPASRLLFTRRDVYLVLGDGKAQCLTQDGQMALSQIFCDPLVAEMQGRLHVLRPGLARTRSKTASERPARRGA